jgi:hypothetical protein
MRLMKFSATLKKEKNTMSMDADGSRQGDDLPLNGRNLRDQEQREQTFILAVQDLAIFLSNSLVRGEAILEDFLHLEIKDLLRCREEGEIYRQIFWLPSKKC